MKSGYNLNHEVVIYLSTEGWERVKYILQEKYRFKTEEELDEFIQRRKTYDNGFKEQLWVIMADLGEIFLNGTPYLDSANIKLCENG